MDNKKISPIAKIIKSFNLDKNIESLPKEIQYHIYFYSLITNENPIRNIMNNYFNKCMYIRKFNLNVTINKCDKYLCNRNYYSYFDYDDKHTLDVLIKYNNSNIIHIVRKLEHDGYDQFGPESNIHYLWIYYKKGYDMFCDRYSREYWFHGEDNDEYIKW